MEEQSSYLKRIKFDPNLLKSFIAKYLSNPRLVILFVITIIVSGIYSYINLPRNLNPSINIPIVIVSTVLPGAGPTDIEKLITIPVEDSVRGVDRVKKVTSTSRDSVSMVSVEFESGINPDDARDDIQSAVDTVNLPEDAQDPNIRKIDFENQPVWTFNIYGKVDSASLMTFARELRTELEDLPSVDRVDISGLEQKEVQILIKPEVISNYGVNIPLVSNAIKNSLSSFPAGVVSTGNSTFSLTLDPLATDLEDIRNLKININNNVYTLDELAIVSERSVPDQTESYIAPYNGEVSRAVTFNVFRNLTTNIDKAVSDSEELVNEKIGARHGTIELESVTNTAELIDEQFADLQRDFTIVIILVFVILLIFLGLRQAIVASLAVPLCFFITFVVMQQTHISLSFISLFSLLLSLGLLVDDTIVIASAMTAYWRTNRFSPIETGLLVWKDFLIPVLTTTVTTVWAFIPLLLASGIIGEFIKPIPIVVSTTLIASIIVALFVTLPFVIVLLQGGFPRRVKILFRILIFIGLIAVFYFLIPKSQVLMLQILALLVFVFITSLVRDLLVKRFTSRFNISQRKNVSRTFNKYVEHGFINFGGITENYRKLIHQILISRSARIRVLVMVIIFSLFSYMLVGFGLVKNEFFPRADQDSLYVSVEFPQGTSIQTTQQEALSLLSDLKNTEGIKYVSLDLGLAYNAAEGLSSSGNNSFLFTLVLPKDHQTVKSTQMAERLREKYASYTKGDLSVVELSSGPPAGADLQIKLFGPDLAELDNYANKVIDYLKTQEGVTNVDKTIKSGTSKIVFKPDPNKLAQAGIGIEQIGLTLRTFASGFNVDKITLNESQDEEQDIVIRLSDKTQTADSIYTLAIPTQTGSVPLSSLGTLSLEPNPALITREGGRRTISVFGSVRAGFNIPEKNSQLEKFADTLDLPSGYGWETGGVNDENQQSVNSILQAMILSFILIITTMVVQFSSFRKALIVMLVIPLAASGVFIIFALTNTPLSFPALIGVLALFGIVVKNSILVVDKIIENQKIGMNFEDSISDGAASRLEAITLTSVATIAGLIPITISDPLWRGLGGAIIAGLTFSGTIMLFFIPLIYYWLFRGEAKQLKNR